MNQTQILAVQVNDILSKYIQVHEDIFKASLRRSIPIPGIFKPIDFGSHQESLAHLESQLREYQRQIPELTQSRPEHSNFLAALQNYTEALVRSINLLRGMAQALNGKANREKYSISQYNNDSKTYKASVRQCTELGGELNRLNPTIKT